MRRSLILGAGALLLTAGCSGSAHDTLGTGGNGGSAGAPGPSGTATDEPLASIGAGATGGSDSAPSGASGGVSSIGSSGTSTHDSTKAPRLPSPAGMQPPTVTGASVIGCEALTGGGWRATFEVTFTGGDQWAVLPVHGPVTATGGGTWRIVIEVGASTAHTVKLSQVEVGGGSPFRTAYVLLPPDVAPTATCPS